VRLTGRCKAYLRKLLDPYPAWQEAFFPGKPLIDKRPIGRPQPGQRIKLDFGPHEGSILATAIGPTWPLLGVQYALDKPYRKVVRHWLTGRPQVKLVYERVIAAQYVAVLKPAHDNRNHRLPAECRYPEEQAHRFIYVPGQVCYRCASTEIVRLVGHRQAPAICRACNFSQVPREQWTDGQYVEIAEFDPTSVVMRTGE